MLLNAVIIDDIDEIRTKNKKLIFQYCNNVNVVGEADSVLSGIDCIKKHKPDLVFLDLELGDGNGFDLLKKVQPLTFKVIFITAHEKFAIQAFRYSAIDYLLKPIDKDDLVNSVNKAQEALGNDSLKLKINTLLHNIEPTTSKKIVFKTAESVHVVNIKDIIRCESFKNYTQFHIENGDVHTISSTLKEYEDALTPYGFFRTHQSHIINMNFFDHYSKRDGGYIVMKNKSQVPLAVRKKDEFFSMIEKL